MAALELCAGRFLFGVRCCYGGYVTFQPFEVAIPWRLFAEILRLIAGLQPRPAPT